MADAPTPNTPPPAGVADAASASATSASTGQTKSALDRFLAWCLRHWLLTGITLLIGSCAFMTRDRTVTWEEEVPLNTGETIWVTRSMPWVYKGGFGNPFDMSMLPTGEQTIRFNYDGAAYSFTGKVLVNWIAISLDRKPVLIAIPGSYGWNYRYESAYYCVTPYYVQFVSDESGKNWTWPEKIEPWLFNLPANVMTSIPRLDELRKDRYASKDRDQRDKTYRLQSPYGRQIDPHYDADGDCPKKVDSSFKPNGSKK